MIYHHQITSEDLGYVPSNLTMPSGAVFYAPLATDYNRALDAEEIAKLANEFHPTA